MDAAAQAHKAERIEAVVAQSQSRRPAAEHERVALFVREFLRRADPEDLAARGVDELGGAALSALDFAGERVPGAPKLRVFNPTVAEHGWQSRHTVVEIVNDDMPFLVDSVTMEINRQGLRLHLILHPLFDVKRDARGALAALAPRGESGGAHESVMHIEVDRVLDPAAREALASGLTKALRDVRAAVNDWPAMRARLTEAAAELEAGAPAGAARDEALAFLRWLSDNHFVLLGYRRHRLVEEGGRDWLHLDPGSDLGVLRVTPETAPATALPRQAHAVAHSAEPLVISKANARATVHRPGYVDYIGIKRFDAAGRVAGEHRFLGLFTSSAYSERAAEIPLVRGKVAAVLERAGLAPGSHLAKAAAHILETYPRDELFQIEEDALYDTTMGILSLGERQRLRLFVRRDPFDRFASCLIYVPRDAYDTELRVKFQRILAAAYEGSAADFDVYLTDAPLARIHVLVRTDAERVPEVNLAALEGQLAEAASRWIDRLRDELVDREGEARAVALLRRWGAAFPAAYRDQEPVSVALADLRKIETLAVGGGLALALYRPLQRRPGAIGFKIFHAAQPVALSDSLPMLEKMGVRVLEEHAYRLEADGEVVWIHDFLLQTGSDLIDVEAVAPLFEQVYAQMMRGEAEVDGFNRLVLGAGLGAQEIGWLRAYAKYMRQARFDLSQSFIEATLAAHPAVARQLAHLFRLRFEPEAHDAGAAATQVRAIEQALEKVANLNEDRVLRQLLALVQATLRTNAFRGRSHLSFKFDSAKVPGLPEPRPWVEVFVSSPRFEGIHLRGGKVARGGLRWSDRPEDFRTEVLGLVKAQMVKNTVIVPVGSKGGFVLKKAPPATDREAFMKEGVACYQDYLRGLLDLTDNLVAGKVVAPERVVRHDGDDPYLVVAADKGTATFSDYANAVSREYGYWLDDAFASGGSAGYDHKKMGITARGAWEAVKRHFRELGRDIQSEPFSVAGIGDMSGDVFGNGMLLSRHTRLIAAFDHRHIFLDPAPDAAASFAERERLFALPRSSWADYDAKLISEGGGIWARSEKSIPVSPQVAAVLGIEPGRLSPTELISAILKAPVDLLYNGGIGTYIKASTETHADVGDRASDAFRIDGRQLRCKVVCEGGNLGCTQLGRIEYALHGCGGIGGRIFTDAIDNSAGVDTSDHEVNIKILLGLVMAEGELTEKQRNKLLAEMTDEVGTLVLRDNYYQTQALSLSRRLARPLLEQQARFMRFLEKAGRLNRALEFLPDDDTIAERREQGIGLTAPESAVLLAYCKLWLFDELVGSDTPDDPFVADALRRYFPAPLRERYAAYMDRHPLKREIVATYVLNSMVNRVGATFVHRQSEMLGVPPAQVVRAYLLTREVFGYVPMWQRIEALDNVVSDAVQGEMLTESGRLIIRAVTWFARSRRGAEPMEATFARYAPAVAALRARLAGTAGAMGSAPAWMAAGVPAELAADVAMMEALYAALDVAEIAESTRQPLADVAEVHATIGARLGLTRLRGQVNALTSGIYWQGLAKAALGDDL
ncbi:MAG: hypothetical protein RI936_586, partial [Pseudomonadota bacterium]